MHESPFSAADLRRQLEARGVTEAEASRQLEQLLAPPPRARLARPCTVGDGIRVLAPEDLPELHEAHAAAARDGRFVKFTPASGAASRMFRELLHFHLGPGRTADWSDVQRRAADGEVEAAALRRFVEELDRFAFRDDLERSMTAAGSNLASAAGAGRVLEILAALLDPARLDYAGLPKGLLKFHAYPGGARTAFEEHLAEGLGYARDRAGGSRLHFTVSPSHREAFGQHLASIEPPAGRRFDVGFSEQKPSTDTLAVDLEGRPLRDDAGRLVLRPGGHGALIENLNDLAGDLVFVKNVDNVQHECRRAATLIWKRALGGLLVRLEQRAHALLRRLRTPAGDASALGEGEAFAEAELGLGRDAGGPDDRRERLIRVLDRPLRVCGMVRKEEEPGGGPFWVRDASGRVTPQIVEGAEIDTGDAEQRRILEGSTHFNPVDLVCAVRDAHGRPFDLRRFVDPDAVMHTTKSAGGRDLTALERPGLWNGAMAGWNTIFVEVPLATFTPVKTVLDLLRPAHQP